MSSAPVTNAVRTADADRLLQLAARKSAQGRETLYRTLWDFFEQRSGTLTEAERALMTDILRRLSRDIEMSIRIELARSLSAKRSAPRDLARVLADQEIEVAFPILMESRVLEDVDLIEVIRTQTHQHRLAVALRKDISNDVCEALVDNGSPEVVVAMLRNDTAKVGQQLMDRIADASRWIEAYQEPLLARADLPPALARRMQAWVSAALRQFIVEKFKVDADEVDDELSGALDKSEKAEVNELPRTPIETMVERLAQEGKLTIDFVMRALRRGEVATFEAAFAQLAGIRLRLARRIIYEPGGEAFAIACIAARIDKANCLRLFELTRRAHDLSPGEIADQSAALAVFYDQTTPEAAEVVARKWRRNPIYLAALKQIGAS
jgi:uncharacterized protein (DUF2336 family)